MDVTSSCKSPMNTGVQRVVRELFRGLSMCAPVTPVLWDPGLGSYCSLSTRERGFLGAPFARARSGRGSGDPEPGRRANPVPFWSKFARRIVHRRNRLDLGAIMTAADGLFVPEIFQDNRLAWLADAVRLTPARIVGVCHDAIAWRRPDITPPARQAGFGRYLAVLGGFHHVLCVSRETAGDLRAYWQEHGVVHAPVTVCGWPVNHAGTARPIHEAPGGGQRPLILCVGTFEPRKNHLVLLDAARMLWDRGTDFQLVLVGRTTAHWGGRVIAAMESLQAAGRPVRWLRHVHDRMLAAAYQECAFTVFPSLLEGFGLPILESLWHGRPCVCGSNGAIGEAAGSGGGCLAVDQTDPVALAGAMERLLNDRAFHKRLCKESANRSFDTWESVAERLLPLFCAP